MTFYVDKSSSQSLVPYHSLDTGDHPLILDILYSLGIQDPILSWFSSQPSGCPSLVPLLFFLFPKLFMLRSTGLQSQSSVFSSLTAFTFLEMSSISRLQMPSIANTILYLYPKYLFQIHNCISSCLPNVTMWMSNRYLKSTFLKLNSWFPLLPLSTAPLSPHQKKAKTKTPNPSKDFSISVENSSILLVFRPKAQE